MSEFDVFIAGAGPAGCATAISLSEFAPSLRICLAGAPTGETPRIGEVVPPLIRPILEHLGLWDRFCEEAHIEAYRTVSAWGAHELGSNEFLESPYGVGWHLDRERFDWLLAREARKRVDHHVAARVRRARHDNGRWWLSCDGDAGSHTARIVVDATGRAAALSRAQGASPARPDRLIGCFLHFEGCESDGDGLLIETFSDGWWYTASLPCRRRVVACMTDADIVRDLSIHRLDPWMHRLDETRFVRAKISDAKPSTRLRLRPAGSQRVESGTPVTLIPVGDAASCFDPISSQGITKALRSGIFASYAIADRLCRGDERGLRRYHSFGRREFRTYWKTLLEYYSLERRWPDHAFWQRRHVGLHRAS